MRDYGKNLCASGLCAIHRCAESWWERIEIKHNSYGSLMRLQTRCCAGKRWRVVVIVCHQASIVKVAAWSTIVQETEWVPTWRRIGLPCLKDVLDRHDRVLLIQRIVESKFDHRQHDNLMVWTTALRFTTLVKWCLTVLDYSISVTAGPIALYWHANISFNKWDVWAKLNFFSRKFYGWHVWLIARSHLFHSDSAWTLDNW